MTTPENSRRLYRDADARQHALDAIDHAISTMNSFIDLTGDEMRARREACDRLRHAREVLR